MRSGAAVALEESESVRPSESESQIELQQLKGLRGVSVHWHIVSSFEMLIVFLKLVYTHVQTP
jgi:hypothetical protein